MSDANKLLIRCAWAGNAAFVSAGYDASDWGPGSCPPQPPSPPLLSPRVVVVVVVLVSLGACAWACALLLVVRRRRSRSLGVLGGAPRPRQTTVPLHNPTILILILTP